jgi:hypothetical protein
MTNLCKVTGPSIDGPVTFFLYDLTCYFILNDVDIQLILEFKKSFQKIVQSFLKILKGSFFWNSLYVFGIVQDWLSYTIVQKGEGSF